MAIQRCFLQRSTPRRPPEWPQPLVLRPGVAQWKVRALRGCGGLIVLAAGQAAGQRVVWDQRNRLFRARRQLIALKTAEPRVAERLHKIDTAQILHFTAAPDRGDRRRIAERQAPAVHRANRMRGAGWAAALRKSLTVLKRVVLPEGIELSTSPLPRGCSTTELRQQIGHTRAHARLSSPAVQRLPYEVLEASS